MVVPLTPKPKRKTETLTKPTTIDSKTVDVTEKINSAATVCSIWVVYYESRKRELKT
jgi:hypothetical protein